jgi:tetraacyldisaccharide 4'-kinase
MRDWLERVWYGRAGGAALLPLSALYSAALRLRSAAFRSGFAASVRVGRPVIVVGNLTVGGTGKTPLVAWLVEALSARGVRVGIVSRGYGRSDDAVRTVDAQASWRDVGDEPLLLARRTRVPVVVGRDRVAAARRLVEMGVAAIVSDDGLQHLRLARDFELVVLDGTRGFGNARLLPAGPLREPAARLQTVDAVVVNGSSTPVIAGAPPSAVRATMRMVVDGVLPVSAQPDGAVPAPEPLEAWRGRTVHAVAGIGHPQRFFALLREHGLATVEHAFPDHHALTVRDLAFGDGAPVLMTEKDAVKCTGLDDARLRYVRVSARLDEHGGAELLARVQRRIDKP